MVTIQDLLDLPEFSYLSLLNSNADLDREIDTIETTETPDVAEYLPKNTFLLTTGMAFQGDPEGFREFIRSLDALPIAGLGIKHGRYIDEVDASVLEYADELGFPLIHVPTEQTLGNVSHHLLSYLWDNQSGAMHTALNLQKQFSEKMLKGASVENLVKYLGSVLKIPIILKDPFLNVVASSHQFNEKSKNMAQFQEDSQAFLDSQLADYPRKQPKKALQNESYYIHPIKLDTFFSYYLILMKNKKGAFPLSNLMIEQASVVLSHTLYKNIKLIEKNINAKKTFFDRLVNTDKKSIDKMGDWYEYGQEFGLIDSGFYRTTLCHFQLKQESTLYSDTENISYSLIFDWIEREIKRDNEDIILFPSNSENSFGILVQSEIGNYETILQNLNKKIQAIGLFDCHFFIGSPVFSPRNIHYSFKEALEVFQTTADTEDIPLITYYETKNVSGLINYIPEHVKRHFCLVNLKELAYPADESLIELRNTLKTFLDSQSEIKLTSERLFVHRNTVKYRIAKCKELLGSTLDNPEDTLNLRMALIMSEQDQEGI